MVMLLLLLLLMVVVVVMVVMINVAEIYSERNTPYDSAKISRK